MLRESLFLARGGGWGDKKPGLGGSLQAHFPCAPKPNKKEGVPFDLASLPILNPL